MAAIEEKLLKVQNEVISDYFVLTREAEVHRDREDRAAVAIQSAWRGYLVRRNLRRLGIAATRVQKHFRGHLGREYAAQVCRERDRDLRMAYFNHHATVIQKRFRGFYSRKHIHSFLARAEYIEAVVGRGELLRQQLSELHEQQVREAEAAELERRTLELATLLQKKHHLLSTKVCPGIFNPRFAALSGGKLAVDGAAVEDHLSRMFESEDFSAALTDRSSRGRSQRSPNRHHGEHSSVDERRRTLRTMAPFSAVDEALKQETLQQKLLNISNRPFITTVNSCRGPLPLGTTIRTDTKFGVAEMLRRAEKRREASRNITHRPFVTTVHKAALFEDVGYNHYNFQRLGQPQAPLGGNTS